MSRRSISKSPGPFRTNEEGVDKEAYERRRNQVRRAQKSHRERKANYLKALEQEVVGLRNQNSQNIHEYEDEVRMLQGILMTAGISPPPRLARIIPTPAAEVDPSHPSSFTVSKHAGLGQALHLHIPESMSRDNYGSSASSHKGSDAGVMRSASVGSSSQQHLMPVNVAAAQSPAASSGGMSEQYSPTTLDKVHGINFVLSLEHHCMEHPDLTRDEFGTHCHTPTHNLLAYAPRNVSGQANWEVPGSSVDSLLDWDPSLQAEGVVSPAQAWMRLKQHPFFSMIDEAQLLQLRDLLINDVKCYGYGSVLDEQVWELAVQTIMMSMTSGQDWEP